CQEIIEMNVAGKVDHIQMVINSPGGGPYAGFAIIDMMEWSRLPIYTTGLGLVASMGLMLFMAGERGRRVLTPRTAILSHRFSGITAGNHSQLLAGRKEEDMLHQRIVDHYLAYSDIPSREELETILLRDVDSWLTPQEAVRHGIADIIENLGPRSGKRA
ncbi:MAG: ATP-dependent Clp protease proteolytic subunit, partial [Desulfovibrionaceae bacterium]